MDPVAELFFNYLRDVIYNPAKAKLEPESLPEGFREFASGLMYYVECVRETTDIARELSRGNLYGKQPSPGNEVSAPLKALCASLRHLTWQAKQVSRGDYTQKVDFMGEFAEAFNLMIEQLNVRQKLLISEIESGKRKIRALAQSKSFFETISKHLPQWLIVTDQAGALHYINHPAAEMLFDKIFEESLYRWLKKQAESTKPIPRNESLELFGNAKEQFFHVVIHELQWDEQNVFVFVLTDISTSRARMKKLEGMAYHDPLTKAYNRAYGMELLSEWLGNRNAFICCFVDMDNLKYVNDKFGHGEGDNYILTVADTLRRFSDNAVVCRLGGDEFMLLAMDWSYDDACQCMENLRDELIAIKTGTKVTYRLSISYGIVDVGTDNTLSAGVLLRTADEKMYEYKRTHKKPPGVT